MTMRQGQRRVSPRPSQRRLVDGDPRLGQESRGVRVVEPPQCSIDDEENWRLSVDYRGRSPIIVTRSILRWKPP